MICGACGHWNDDEEPRCTHCGRKPGQEAGSSWDRSGLAHDRAGTQRRSVSAAEISTQAWRHQISRKLEEYRERREASESLLPPAGDSPLPELKRSPNVVSIAEVSGTHRRRQREREESSLLPPISVPADSGEERLPPQRTPVMPRLGERVPETAVPCEERLRAADAGWPSETPRPQSEVRCRATVAPVQVRLLSGLLDIAMIIVALGAFLGVFHWMGGALFADREGVHTLGVTSFALTAFYWIFYAGFLGETPGMTWTGVRLLDFHGRSPTGKQRAARALGLVFSSATLGVGFAWALIDEEKLTWHDRISKTFLSRDQATGRRTRSNIVEARPRRIPDLPPSRQV